MSAFSAEDLEAIRHRVEDAIQAEDGLSGGLWIIIELCDAYERLMVVVEAARRPVENALKMGGLGMSREMLLDTLRAALDALNENPS